MLQHHIFEPNARGETKGDQTCNHHSWPLFMNFEAILAQGKHITFRTVLEITVTHFRKLRNKNYMNK